MCAFGAYAALKRPLLHIAFLNVGAGNSILITSPSGNSMLIDGGPDQSVLVALGGKCLFTPDLSMPSLPHRRKFQTRAVCLLFSSVLMSERLSIRDFRSKTTTYKTILNEVFVKKIPHITTNIGDDINLGDGAHFLILSSGAEIGQIIYGQTSISIPEDIPTFSASSTENIVFESDGTNIWRK